MQKAQISYINHKLWRLIYYRPSNQGLKAEVQHFGFYDGAINFWLAVEQQVIKEQKAYSKLQCIDRRLLTIHEDDFINGLLKTKCFKITKRQYGYLSGIYERQSISRS